MTLSEKTLKKASSSYNKTIQVLHSTRSRSYSSEEIKNYYIYQAEEKNKISETFKTD
jgi:hypothetical protein